MDAHQVHTKLNQMRANNERLHRALKDGREARHRQVKKYAALAVVNYWLFCRRRHEDDDTWKYPVKRGRALDYCQYGLNGRH